ncbi:hypothetical protein [Arcobacter sp. F155]|uniref:hypothetical protein n=1 Tax=Arcobacter sp. F155 TaxID=2044512 RepID=UPI00100BEE00|nr:hypothetical protein [Arcobacter sp. F155]
MALINCEECDEQISDKAYSCPHCGNPMTQKESNILSEKINNENTTINKKDEEIKIIGDESLIEPGLGFFGGAGGFILFLGFLGLFEGEMQNFIISIIIASILFFIQSKFSKKPKERYARSLEVYKYFKKKFPLLSEFVPEKHDTLDVVNLKSKDFDRIMFNLYKHAYNLNADAIIINSDNVSTHVNGSISSRSGGSVSSTNIHHLNATVVKYKDL